MSDPSMDNTDTLHKYMVDQAAGMLANAGYLLYFGRALIYPITIISVGIILIILCIYIAHTTTYTTSFGIISALLIISTVGFIVVKYVPTPLSAYIKPLEFAAMAEYEGLVDFDENP